MAECGRPPELDLHLLECPICLERLQKPKSLPCLHCFCQECLGIYITKELSGKMASETSFPCPVCRRVTPPVNPGESKGAWAEQFPTNAVIQDLIQLKERSFEQLYCKPCQTKGKMTNPAKFWCKDMNLNFCDDCKVQHHDILHSECDISGYGNNRTNREKSVLRCDKHDETKVWYCEDHQILGCNICIFKDHRRCEEVTTALEYFQKLKDGSQLADMYDMLKKNTEVIELIVKDFDKQLQNLVQNQEVVLQSITDLRQKVDKRLNTLQKDVTDKLIASFKEEKINMEASLRQCERLMNSMLNTMKSSVTAVEGNDHIETIVLYQRGQAELESSKALLTDMIRSYTSVSIKHQVVKGLGNLADDAMGKIVVKKQPRRFPGNYCDLVPHLLERKVKEIVKFNIKTHSDKWNCRARGVVYLPCDQIVVSDYNNKKLKLFTDKGQFLDELTILGRPNDLCLVDNNTVAVAVYSPGGIRVVKVEAAQLSLSSEIRMPNGMNCYGITHTDGMFIVGTGDGGVCSVTQDGVTDLLRQYNSTCYSLTHDRIKEDTLVSIYNGTPGAVAVSRLSADKRHTDLIKVGVVSGARGVDIDREGNIYVCGYSSNNVVHMSGDGTHVREMLTSTDGIRNPWTISINGDKFVVIDHNDNPIRIFQLY